VGERVGRVGAGMRDRDGFVPGIVEVGRQTIEARGPGASTGDQDDGWFGGHGAFV
jgi:hypothetical protein